MELVAVFPQTRIIDIALPKSARMSHSYEEAFIGAFDEYADALFRHASFRISNRERANDVTQEAFLKAWDYARNGNEVRNWKSFLFRILNNLIIDEYRKHKEESLDAILDDENSNHEELVATGSREEKELALNDELAMQKIQELIPQLPENYQAALTLRFVDGFSPKEIATMLAVSENVASVRIHRAITRLKELMGPKAKDLM